MGVTYERIVEEDFNQGYGPVDVTMPAGGTAVGSKVGLHTFFRGPVLNLKDFGALVDGVTDDSAAMVAAIAELPAEGGEIYIPAGECVLGSLTTIALDYVTISGAGYTLTTLRCTNTTGGIKFTGRFCSLLDIGIYYTGSGAYGVLVDNGTTVPLTGADRFRAQNVKIKGGAGTSHGLWLVNTLHGSYRDLYLPCGGGNAILMEASGFNTFIDPQITINLGESSPKWVNGIVLQKQTGNTVFQCDDNKFFNAIVEGVTGYGILLTSEFVAGETPSRNAFHGGTSEGNTAGDVAIENGSNNSFYDFHTESVAPAKNLWIVGNDGNHGNKFIGCQGTIDINDPSLDQGIQATVIVGHVGNVTIEDSNVFGTRIDGMTGTLTDAGTATDAWISTIGASGTNIAQKYYGGRITGRPIASTATIEGSGGSFANLIALPTNTSGVVRVVSKQDGTNKLAIYDVGFVNGSAGAAIGTPVTLATIGATTAQLTFQVSGTTLQARGANATAPDIVTATLDSIALVLPTE